MAKSALQNFVVRYQPGELVFGEGDIGATMYIVQSGRVKLFREVDGQRRDLGELEKGDFFGEMSILEGLPRTNSAETSEDSELIEINSTTFDKMIKGNIEIAIRMLRKLSIRLREAERRLDEAQVSSSSPVSLMRPSATPMPGGLNLSLSGARLEYNDGEAAYPLRETETLIGRYDPVTLQAPDIDLTDLDLKRSVSRRHARIVCASGRFTIVEEVGALNGTFVAGDKLAAGEPQEMRDGDEIAVGMVKMIFRNGCSESA